MAAWRSKPLVVEGLTSGEFCNTRRRVAHLLTMYGFLLYVDHRRHHGVLLPNARYPHARDSAATVVPRRPDGLRRRLLVLVLHSGRCRRRGQFTVPHCPRRPVHRFACRERDAGPGLGVPAGGGRPAWTNVFLGFYLIATTVFFGSVPWSKFSHMFFKPAAAFQKRVAEANGSRSNLPRARRTNRKIRQRHPACRAITDRPISRLRYRS